MPVWAVKFASVRLCRSIICGLLTIRTLMLWPSVAGFLVGPPPAVDAPLAPVIDEGFDVGAPAAELPPPAAAADELAALVDAELPQAASSNSAAQPAAATTLGLRCIVAIPFSSDGDTASGIPVRQAHVARR